MPVILHPGWLAFVRVRLPVLVWRREYVLEKRFKLSKMVACGSVDDQSPILAVAVDLPHAQSVSFEPPPDLGSPESNVQP
jgi:hypothetical protein